MRKLNKDFDKVPSELMKCARENVQELIETKKVNINCYKKAKEPLEKQFFGKCAYCESKYSEYTRIDHFRPKSIYYWLAYEWSNLLPVCEKCNISKGDKFPVINEEKKVMQFSFNTNKNELSICKADASPLIDEMPYVLHPKIDNPIEYFDFQIDENYTGIKIIGKDKIDDNKYSGRGEVTIEICNLNRNDLKSDRYKYVVAQIVSTFEKIFKLLQLCKVPLSKYENALRIEFDVIIQKSKQSVLDHTLLRRIITDELKFDSIICQAIENENYRKLIKMFYRKYIFENH